MSEQVNINSADNLFEHLEFIGVVASVGVGQKSLFVYVHATTRNQHLIPKQWEGVSVVIKRVGPFDAAKEERSE